MAGSVTPFLRNYLRGLCLSRGLLQLVPSTTALRTRAFSQPAPAQEDPKPLGYPWRIVVATCVERLPSLSQEKTGIERQYEELKDQMRMERSRLSDYELEEREHLRQKREREKKALEEDVDLESTKHSAVDQFEELVEAREQELAAFQPASRETEADRERDMQSLCRRLDQMLYLLVRKPRSQFRWQMPQGGLDEGESLLQAARRELAEECGSELKADFLSSAPSAFHSYRHSLTSDPGIVGTKVFFLKAQYRGGEIHLDQQELVDYVWVTKDEMKDYVSEDYYSAIAPTLIE